LDKQPYLRPTVNPLEELEDNLNISDKSGDILEINFQPEDYLSTCSKFSYVEA
jgi:hypothetical protein